MAIGALVGDAPSSHHGWLLGEAGSQPVRLGRIVICATVVGMDTGNNKLEMLLRLVGPWGNDICGGSEKAVALLSLLSWDAGCKETGRYIRPNHACYGCRHCKQGT